MTKEYSVKELAQLSGISVRTLHHYDQIGLLPTVRKANSYRVYRQPEVERLQQILLYKEMNIKLEDIKKLLSASDYDAQEAMQQHLLELEKQQGHLAALIDSVKKTIHHMKGSSTMQNEERFSAFKQAMLKDNENEYGKEARSKYGEGVVDASNEKFSDMTEATWELSQELDAAFKSKIAEAMESAEGPTSASAKEAFDLHKKWLCMFWPEGLYDTEKHLGLAEAYVSDQRFHDYLSVEQSAFLVEVIIAHGS